LLAFYPLPNFNGDAGYNFQIPILRICLEITFP
jgi:hypothetical protein